MTTVRELIIIFNAVAIVNCQYDYYRPDVSGYNIFGEPFAVDGRIGGGEIPGKAGADYPVFSQVPETGFRCERQRYPGYYADPGAGCQVFHICQRGGRSDSFLCPNGTIFNQEWLVCDWWYNFDCSRAENFYSVNKRVVESMEEADSRLQDYRYNSLRRFVTIGINGQVNSRAFPSLRNGHRSGRNGEGLKYNRAGSGFGGFAQRDGAGTPVFGVPEASGFTRSPGGATGYRRNLFRWDGEVDRSYLPPVK